MRWGISGAPIPPRLLYADPVQRAATELDFPPLFAYAIACRESIVGEMNGKWKSATVVSADGGHGLFQLTYWVPPGWNDPKTNAHYAIKDWLLVDIQRWSREYGLVGDDLIKCAAASFNAGWLPAANAHRAGDVDSVTTNKYGAGVLAIFHNLISRQSP